MLVLEQMITQLQRDVARELSSLVVRSSMTNDVLQSMEVTSPRVKLLSQLLVANTIALIADVSSTTSLDV